MNIGINNTNHLNIMNSFFLMHKENEKNYTLEILTKENWLSRRVKKGEGEEFNLGKLVEIFNARTPENDSEATLQIINRMTAACKKHNDSKIQYLKYLVIPWIFAKIFGWTCLTTYSMPEQIKNGELIKKKLTITIP